MFNEHRHCANKQTKISFILNDKTLRTYVKIKTYSREIRFVLTSVPDLLALAQNSQYLSCSFHANHFTTRDTRILWYIEYFSAVSLQA